MKNNQGDFEEIEIISQIYLHYKHLSKIISSSSNEFSEQAFDSLRKSVISFFSEISQSINYIDCSNIESDVIRISLDFVCIICKRSFIIKYRYSESKKHLKPFRYISVIETNGIKINLHELLGLFNKNNSDKKITYCSRVVKNKSEDE